MRRLLRLNEDVETVERFYYLGNALNASSSSEMTWWQEQELYG